MLRFVRTLVFSERASSVFPYLTITLTPSTCRQHYLLVLLPSLLLQERTLSLSSGVVSLFGCVADWCVGGFCVSVSCPVAFVC